ncbi:hypothetical protein [Actinoplanes sp. NPDC020271]|uniref:hypothetical protein n=1 Tax=Actinoplanes sp. NPDC020271 TaxID=3363896 RepID=UPI0037AB8AC0
MTQSGVGGPVVRPEATVMQHAIRLLVILNACGEPIAVNDPAMCVAVIRAELRLQALDFWLRNPDYLAGELLTKVERGELALDYLAVVEHLLDSSEPDLHWYPMPRWHHGAYEAIDDAFSVLSAYGLAAVRRQGGVMKTARSQFFLTEAGRTAAENLAREPVLSWYTEQVKLVASAAGGDNGSTLKKRQYQQAEYARTKLGVNIAPIHSAVRERLGALKVAVGPSLVPVAGGQA